jgi:phosphotriesterase-related protein
MTVMGPISPDEMGITLAHEHVFFDLSMWRRPPSARTKDHYREPISLKNIDMVRRAGCCFEDNIAFSDTKVAIKELQVFKELGGGTVMDLSSRNIGMDPAALKMISRKTGLNIIAGSGFYVRSREAAKRSITELAAMMVDDIRGGLFGTKIKAGLIGEIGCVGVGEEGRLAPIDIKKIKAAARAHKETGASINIHPPLIQRGEVPEIVSLLHEQGADLRHVAISHMDKPGTLTHGTTTNLAHLKEVASSGVYVSFDGFGMEWPWAYEDLGYLTPTDYERVIAIKELIRCGYIKQILLSQDICQKIFLREYGGFGFGHILSNILPIMKREGVTRSQIEAMLIENPRRFLSSWGCKALSVGAAEAR